MTERKMGREIEGGRGRERGESKGRIERETERQRWKHKETDVHRNGLKDRGMGKRDGGTKRETKGCREMGERV